MYSQRKYSMPKKNNRPNFSWTNHNTVNSIHISFNCIQVCSLFSFRISALDNAHIWISRLLFYINDCLQRDNGKKSTISRTYTIELLHGLKGGINAKFIVSKKSCSVRSIIRTQTVNSSKNNIVGLTVRMTAVFIVNRAWSNCIIRPNLFNALQAYDLRKLCTR